jgi:RNA recognition motif-containing protein
MRIIASNLPFTATEADVADYFSRAVKVVEAFLFRLDGKVNGQAVVRFADEESARVALALDRRSFMNRQMSRVEPWVKRRNRSWT